MTPFKKGDVVKVINDQGAPGGLTAGKIAVVAHDAGNTSDSAGCVKLDGFSANYTYRRDRFELAKPNGVDSVNSPLNFSLSDLKPFQRVKLRRGDFAAVGREFDGRPTLNFTDGQWSIALLGNAEPLDIVEVYDVPTIYNTYAILECGKLLWKEVDATELARITKLAELNANVTKAIAERDAFAAA